MRWQTGTHARLVALRKGPWARQIDVRAVSFGDASLVRLLREATARAAGRGGQLEVLVRPGSGVARVLELTGVAAELHVRDR